MATTQTGIDILLRKPSLLKGRKIGLVTNPTGMTRDLRSTVDALAALKGVTIRALFGPEHGVRGEIQDGLEVASSVDAATGLPVHSLYGKTLKPTREMLDDIDLLIYDIQDVGCRYYTYLYTLSYVMEAAAERDIEVMVLDRPDPINGVQADGPLIEPGITSFVGRYPIPPRYGMTIGEFARYANTEFEIFCNLTVVQMDNWTREMWFDQTGLPWVTPSPNLPTLECAAIYPGPCLFEGTTMSEGRGTTHPFEWIGAPWLNGAALAHELNTRNLPGVKFRPQFFAPTYSKHAGVACSGVQVHITNRDKVKTFELGLHMIDACIKLHPREFEFLQTSWEGKTPHFDLLTGNTHIKHDLLNRKPVSEIAKTWQKDLRGFLRRRKEYLLY